MNEAERTRALHWLIACASEVVRLWNSSEWTMRHEGELSEQIGLLEEALKPFQKEE